MPVAGYSEPWRYVWPRDGAIMAVAYAQTGHRAEAGRILDFLQRSQPDDGVFQARYRPDGSGPPDERGTQLDGTGWALWALRQLGAGASTADQASLARRYAPLVTRSNEDAMSPN